MHAPNQNAGRATGVSLGRYVDCAAYRFMPMTVSSMVSTVVMPLELAWNPRWVEIICTNSRARSTLDCSMLYERVAPKPLWLGTP